MTDEYHELANAVQVTGGDELVFPRSRALVRAIEGHRDFSIVGLYRAADSLSEYIAVDVELDEVPPKNPYGIRYRERLAFWVPEDAQKLIDVRALRKDFPSLLHQNQTLPGDAPSLCLYFEPPLSVLRTWTPQSFLRRVQWWLEKTARNELHPADQPVEQLFFLSKHELILPWDMDARLQAKRSFRISGRAWRPDDGATFFLIDAEADQETGQLAAECLEFRMPPVVHGVIEHHPTTLGELYDQLSERGLDLLEPLKQALGKRVDTAGTEASSDDPCTVFLLHLPICREPGAQPERIHQRAFLVNAGPLQLGEELGVLFQHANRYFNAAGVIGGTEGIEWRSREVMSVEVLTENDKVAARQQSGIPEPGPSAVMVGVGSLGSAMLNLWGRAGWGRWTAIDNDHIKPHNLSRHTALTQHIGEPKAFVVASLHSAAIGDGEVTPLFGDAYDFSNDEVLKPLENAELVVDCSTTLEYPRKASTADDLPRHVSAFMTPDGNSSVILTEDGARQIRLRTLEAQYYRALIGNDWGRDHLAGHLGTFWSGASCRDISTVLPYSRMMVHAGTLADQIPNAVVQDKATIRIWERDPATGRTALYEVEPQAERKMEFGELHLFFDDGVEQQLRSWREKCLPDETGGILLGYYDFNVNAVIVVCGLPAPSDSKAGPGTFERGVAGLAEAVNDATARTGGVVGYVGEWHSHPPKHSAMPSGHDIIQLVHLAFGMAEDGLPALQLIVGETDIQILQGRVPQ